MTDLGYILMCSATLRRSLPSIESWALRASQLHQFNPSHMICIDTIKRKWRLGVYRCDLVWLSARLCTYSNCTAFGAGSFGPSSIRVPDVYDINHHQKYNWENGHHLNLIIFSISNALLQGVLKDWGSSKFSDLGRIQSFSILLTTQR
jgi:hypothetical protein